MLREKKRLEIENICYANVSGMFAVFCNEQYRGCKFEWSNFPDMMEREADLWMITYNVCGSNRELINSTAKQFAREIATKLVRQSEFVKEA